MDDIQSWWEVPSIAHFCSLFRAAFNLLDFDIEELEEALLTDGTEDSGSSLLQELIVRLLCGCLGNNDISTFNYQMFLRRLFRQKCQEYGRDNPFNTDMDFQFLPLRTKVEILHALCDFRLDADDVQDLLKNLESDSLRVEPLGHDENHSAYWYFYGTRLYREDFPKAKKKAKEKRRRGKEEKKRKKRDTESESEEKGTGVWQVVCFTEEDWDKVTQSFKDSTSKNERALFHTLAEDFLPEIPRLFAEKERLQRKRLLEYQPRRQSSRLEKLKQQKEEEEKLLQREEEERLLRQEREKKERLQDSTKDSRASRALLRSLSRTNSECGSVSSIPDSLTDSKSNRSSTFVGRQTNNSLSSATGQIVIQGLRRKLRSSQVFKQTEEDLQTGMYKILEHIKNHDDAWPFADPVDEDYAPRYYSIIRQPMDLQRMEDKLDEGEYLTFADFKADFQLIVDNCKQYNGTDNEYTEMVANLQEAFQTAAERYLESDPSSDEEVAVEFPTSSESRSEPQRHKHHHHRHHHRARRKKEKSKHRSSHTGSSSQKTSVSSRVPCAPSPDSAHTSTARASSTEKEEPEPPDPEPSVHDLEAGAESEGSSTREDTANELKRPHSHNGSTKRRKKTGVIKNAAAIEALELATEQTLKDINKWLDDTPRFSEFSSASNSPSHLMSSEEYDTMGSRIESEYRRNFKMERDCKTVGPPGSRPSKDTINKRRSTKDASKPNQRRREVQRTIERLQPGKSKGNLISNIQSANKSSEEGLSGCSGLLNKPKENRNSLLVKTDEATPKLSLGTVLTSDVLGFGHNFEESTTDDRKCASPEGPATLSPKEVSPERTVQSPEMKKEEEPVVADEVKQEKATPNLSAWFKAFGAPKTTAVPKQKKIEVAEEPPRSPGPSDTVPSQDKNRQQMEEKVEDSPSPSQPVPLAQRQRKMSTGSSMSERSSFSQDPMDPLDSYPAPYPSPLHRSPMAASPVMASPRPEDTPKPTASYPPLNGTIRVGFYQDTSSSLQKSSPEKSPQSPSPYQQPLYSPRYPPPPDYLSYRNQPPPAYDALPVTAYGSVMQYYDTSKPLTDQYRAARTQSSEEFASAGYSPPRPVVTTSPLPTPVNLERPSAVPATTSGLLSTLPFSSSQQQDFEITVPRPTLVQKPKPAPAHSSSDTIRPSTMFPVKKRLYSEVDTTQRAQPSAPSPPRRPPPSPEKVKPDPSKEKHIQISERLYQNTVDPSRTTASAPQSPPPIHNVGNDLSFRRGPFSPAAPTPIGNLANLSHIVDRFPEGAPFYASAGDKSLVAASHLFSQTPVSSAAAAMAMFSQAASTIPYNRAVTELSSVLSGKAADVQSVYSRSVPELTSVLSGKSAPSLSGFTHPTVDAANKATVSLETQPTYSLSSMLTSKVPPSASSTYNRSLESSTIVKPSRKRKLKAQSATTTSETSVPSSSISSTTAFQQYVSEPSAISLKTVPGSAFNFGPAPSGLGIYGDAAGFLDEYRTSAGGYYIPPGPAPESGREKQTSAPTAPSPFQFLGHPQPRPPPTYPQLAAQAFMNHQSGLMDAASAAAAPLYQQYLQRHPEELLRAPVVLHQGLLAPPTGYPPGYHPALGIRQPFDALNRPSWL